MFKLHMKDPGSAITHFIAMIQCRSWRPPLLLKSYRDTGHFTINSLSLAIFIVSMILLLQPAPTTPWISHQRSSRILREN